MLAGAAVELGAEGLQQRDVAPGTTSLFRDGEEARRARIVRLMDRMAEAGQGPAFLAMRLDDVAAIGLDIAFSIDADPQDPRAAFHRADKDIADREQPRRKRRLRLVRHVVR